MKRCPVAGCTTEIAEKQLVCYFHWDMMPALYKRRQNKTWYVGGSKEYMHELTGQALTAVRDAATAR